MINTTINIMTQDGALIPLNEKIKEVRPVASQPSIIDEITQKSGQGFYTGNVIKKVKRTQEDSKVAAALGGVGAFKEATSQNVHKVFINKFIREDNIVYNEADLKKLNEGKGVDIVAAEAGDFIITGRELDVKLLLADAKTKATALKLFSVVDTNTNATGAQPAASDGTFDKAIEAIKGGLRVVPVTNFDEAVDTRLQLLRAVIQYLNEQGTDTSTEAKYPFAINGHDIATIKVITRYADAVAIKDKDTTNFINVNGSTMRNITGMIGYIDNTVKVLLSNQIPATSKYVVATNRLAVRDLDASMQYIGKVRDAAAVVIKGGTTVNLKPNERLLQFLQARTQGIVYEHEVFFLDQKATV